MARRDARRFRLRGEGPSRHRQQPQARRDPARRSTGSSRAASSSSATSSARSSGSSRRSRSSTPTDFGAFLALLPREEDGRPLMHVVEVRQRELPRPGIRRPAPRATRSPWSTPTPTTTRRSPTSPPTSSMPACSGRRRRSTPATPPPTSTPGRRARSSWPSGGAPDDLAALRREGGGEEEAAGLRLHDQRRQGPCAGRCHGADRTGQVGPEGARLAHQACPRPRSRGGGTRPLQRAFLA